jgi:formylglycine-generating enzyme required for sulfatase activity
VGDWYEGYGQVPPAGVDVQGPASGSFRVYRGGSWGIDPQSARFANRNYGDPGNRSDYLGVWLLRTAP